MTADVGARAGLQADQSLAYLLGRLAVLELAVRAAVTRRRGHDPDPDNPLRGVYLSDDYADWLLDTGAGDSATAAVAPELDAMRDRLEGDADVAEANGADVRLRRLSRSFALDDLEEELLVVALAPMLDHRFGQFYAYLNDDVTRQYATVALAAELASGRRPSDPRQWLLASPGARLVASGLIEVGGRGTPLPVRPVHVAERIVAFLLGDDSPDPAVADHLLEVEPLPFVDPAFPLAGPSTLLVRQRPGTDAVVESATWLAAAGKAPLVARLPAPPSREGDGVLPLLLREAALGRRALVCGPVDAHLGSEEGSGSLRRLLAGVPVVVLWGRGELHSGWAEQPLPVIDLDPPPLRHRLAVWRSVAGSPAVPDEDLRLLAEHHRVGAAHIRRAVDTAVAGARLAGTEVDRPTLEAGVRAQHQMAAHGVARRVRPTRTWADLVLRGSTRRKLQELVGMIRHRDALAESWGLARGPATRGVSALFVGHSGTGKTLAAEVLAHEVGMDLYTVNLAGVVDKYVGETEKNLDRVLTAAEGVAGLLFFDEAEALLGRRGEVRQGHDRYANLEVSFLLQRLESLNAVVVMATNMRSQVDEAFLRRMDSVVEFTTPDAAARTAIWQHHLRLVERADDVDVDFCARSFQLSGGNIRNAVSAAACLAAEGPRPVTMADLVRGVEREYEKLGRLRSPAEFGRYADLLEGDA